MDVVDCKNNESDTLLKMRKNINTLLSPCNLVLKQIESLMDDKNFEFFTSEEVYQQTIQMIMLLMNLKQLMV
jgi:hypothetical protein